MLLRPLHACSLRGGAGRRGSDNQALCVTLLIFELLFPPVPAVCVVVLVTAVNNYQKEQQFRMLQAVSSDIQASGVLPCNAACWSWWCWQCWAEAAAKPHAAG